MKLSYKVLLAVFASLFFAAYAAFAGSDLNVAVVDVNQLQTQFLTEVNDKLKLEFKDKQDKLQKELDGFKSDKEKFDKDSKTMSQSKLEAAAKKLQENQISLQQKVQSFDLEVDARRKEELQKKLTVLSKVVKEISDKDKYDLILAKNAALFAADKFDITTKVLDGYNKAKDKN